MNRRFLCFACLSLIVIGSVTVARAQYILPQDTMQKAAEDSVAAPPPHEESTAEDSVEAAPAKISETALTAMAQTWVRRLLYRGALETKVVGAYAQYQLTAWSEISGSFGPVEARVTVSYLGSTKYKEKNAEWLQAIFQTMESEPQLVEFDLTVPAVPELRTVYQVYYRLNKGLIRETSFSLPEGAVDPDSSDRPVSEGADQVKLYAGTYEAEKYRGTGEGGVEVVIYRSPEVPPLGTVRLGYGDQGLTLTGSGDDAAPRFLPPGSR
jgi:hypothetical protein